MDSKRTKDFNAKNVIERKKGVFEQINKLSEDYLEKKRKREQSFGIGTKIKAGLLGKAGEISRNLTGFVNNVTQGIVTNYDKLRPVYRVAITFPTKSYDEDMIVPHTIIVADTSTVSSNRLKSGFKKVKKSAGFGITDVLGIWVDQDDVASPDKAVVIFNIDSKITAETVFGNKTIDDNYFTLNSVLSVRNWMDIWIGYEQIDSTIKPDDFVYFSETHVFSGPIVLVNRNYSNAGDVIHVTGFSGEIILKNAKLKSLEENNDDTLIIKATDSNGNQRSFNEGLYDLFNSIVPMSFWVSQLKAKRALTADKSSQGGTKPPTKITTTVKVKHPSETIQQAFVIGDFYWALFERGINHVKEILLHGRNISGLDKYDSGHKIPPLFDALITKNIFKYSTNDPNRKLKSNITLDKNPNFWDSISYILKPERSNNIGLQFKLFKNHTWKMKHSRNQLDDIVEEGLDKHSGVFFHFYFAIEIDEYDSLLRNIDKPGVADKIDAETEVQYITLGDDVIDIETYIDYTTVFNSFRFKVQGALRFKEGDPYTQKDPVTISFPLDHQKIGNLINPKNRLRGFWASILLDLYVYGEQTLPVEKWFQIDVQVHKDNVEKAMKQLAVDRSLADIIAGKYEQQYNTQATKDVLNNEGIARMFKRYYFGGLEGHAMNVGNPSLKVGRFLGIKDMRNTFNVATGSNFNPDKLASAIFGGFGKSDPKDDLGTKMFRKITDFSLATANKTYYIWKVRHYLGAKSGYQTKVYFTQSRSRAWRLDTKEDIAQTMRTAQKVSKSL